MLSSDLGQVIWEEGKVCFSYADLDGRFSDRIVRPLIMAFYRPGVVLAGWCELREGFSRIPTRSDVIVLDERKIFSDPRRTANDFLREEVKQTSEARS
jgi:predicted DNA-binding transcriptional regulator YafY